MSFTPPARFNASSFSVIRRFMMQSDSLPLTEAIDDERVRDVFAKHNVNFGSDPETIYTPAITLWALICQVLFSEEHRSCKAAVLRVAAYFASVGQIVCGTNTGNYCRARGQIPSEAVREIALQIATDVEATVEHQMIQRVEIQIRQHR